MLDNSIIYPIIDSIISKTTTLKQFYKGQIIQTPISEEEFLDKKKEVQGILTEFVVNEFFPQAENTKEFIKLVYGTFNNALNLYKQKKGINDSDIFFVYKGGNILRFVGYEVMHELGGRVADEIEKNYKDAFKKSDADFSIYINPNISNYDLIYNDMNLLAYLLQDKLRDEFYKDMGKYFVFYKLNDQEKKNIIIKYVEKLNQTETIKNNVLGKGKIKAIVLDGPISNVENYKDIKYMTDPDFFTDFNKYNNRITEKVDLKSGNGGMRISSNQTLEFVKQGQTIKFSLVRTKIVFNTYFESSGFNELNIPMMLGGELIDVSLPHKNDSSIPHYFEHLNNNVTEYKIGDELTFKAPSLTYLVEDLEKILFADSDYPWDDSKYMKRLRRVLFMYYCMLLVNKNLGTQEKIIWLKYVKDNIFGKLLNGNNVIGDIDVFLNRVNKNDVEHYPFTILLGNLKSILGKSYDKDKFKEYCQTIYDNIAILITFYEKREEQCKNTSLEGTINMGNILWGGDKDYKRKYLKYKSKYLKLKHEHM
jgi:hypothetical protein